MYTEGIYHYHASNVNYLDLGIHVLKSGSYHGTKGTFTFYKNSWQPVLLGFSGTHRLYLRWRRRSIAPVAAESVSGRAGPSAGLAFGDADKDLVPVLNTYAQKKGVQYDKWRLLTGNKEEIYNLGRKYYFVEEDLDESRYADVFLHTENFVLIDRHRRIRGIYNGLDPNSVSALEADIVALRQEE